MTTARTRSSCTWLVGLALLLLLPAGAAAQSVESVVSAMEDTYRTQMESVDTYIVKTDMYTTYSRKLATDDGFTMESVTRLNDDSPLPTGEQPASTAATMLRTIEDLRKHATYSGTEVIDRVNCHVLTVDDPSKMDSGMGGDQMDQIRYYINAATYQPHEMRATAAQGEQGTPLNVEIRLRDYRTVDGLSMPYRTEIQTDLSPAQKQQMQQMMNMPEEQKNQMRQMMGAEQFDRLERMLNGEALVINVTDLQVNAPLPDGIFGDS